MSKRIVFMGTPEFAVHSLHALIKTGVEVAAVVTAPDKPAGRGRQLRSSAVKQRAHDLGLHVLQPEKLKDPGFQQALRDLRADLFVVVAFRMLPESVWGMPPLGTINLHASLLPRYRGAAPINWAVMNGEQITGATTFFIRHEIDTGDILMSEELAIGQDETAGELHDRLALMGGSLLARTVSAVLSNTASSRAQAGSSDDVLPSAPKLNPEVCRINWSQPAKRVHDHVRGLSPSPGAWTTIVMNGHTGHFKVLRSSLTKSPTNGATPGAIDLRPNRLWVACADDWLDLLEVQAEGKRRMNAAEFVRGLRPDKTISLQ